MALSIFGTLFLTFLKIFPNSSGKVYPTVSGILIVVAPQLIASSIHLKRKSISEGIASKRVAGTKPVKKVISEGATLTNRFKKLANIR